MSDCCCVIPLVVIKNNKDNNKSVGDEVTANTIIVSPVFE